MESDEGSRGSQWAGCTLLAIFGGVLALHPIHETDPFWRLSQGRAVLAHGARVVPEFSAFAAFTEPAIAPQWLWDASTAWLHGIGSWGALAAAVCLLSAVASGAIVRLVERARGARDGATVFFVSALAMALVVPRFRLRPQTAAFALVPAFLLLAARYRDARGRRRWGLGASLVALEVGWAQLHGSFVLAPVLFAIVAFGCVGASDRRRWQSDAVVLQALILGLATSAHGFGIVGYVLSHASGPAVGVIAEMQAPSWAFFDPTTRLYGPLYALMWGVAIAGMLWARQIWWREFALGGVGLVLGLTAVRFFGMAAILLAPLCVRAVGAALEPSPPRVGQMLRVAMGVVAIATLALTAHREHVLRGPLGVWGPAEGEHPVGAARFLVERGGGWNVLTDYEVGGQLGLWTDGAIRTFVDSRTPAYFSDADFGAALEIWSDPHALAWATRRFGVGAIVTDRRSTTCNNVGPEWVPAVVEPRFTTFVPRARGPALAAVAPCGVDYVTARACDEDGSRLEADLDRLAGLGAGPSFLALLEVAGRLACGGDLGGMSDRLAELRGVRGYAQARDRVLARYHLARGEPAHSWALLAEPIRAGDLTAWQLVAAVPDAEAQVPPALLREALEGLAGARGLATPAAARVALARACARQGDLECARAEALRASVRGAHGADAVLGWVAEVGEAESSGPGLDPVLARWWTRELARD